MNESNSQSGNSSEGHTLLRMNDSVRLNLFTSLVQVMVWPFLCIEVFMIFVFLKKEAFRAEARYVMFAQTLFADSCILVLTDFVVITMHVQLELPISICIPLVILMDVLSNVSPTIIVAMCLERYVAICMPLRHVDIFAPNRTVLYIALIWLLCFFIPFVDLIIMLAFATKDYFEELTFCYYEIMFYEDWHMEMRGIFYIGDCLMILSILLFCYVSIIVVAHRASGDDKQSASKGQRTILLHLFQLLLSTLEVMCPYVESQVLEISLEVYLIVRFFNFLAFSILAKIMSTLIYGLRDEKFLAAMKFYVTLKSKVHHVPNK
ncbi:odorant receptor 131-2-like [Alosa alosa]|uniref:odorant receptor 131-2-like n=1 Tax=Alosa alosa TaxID=278164 RepID=UPI00201553C4|nr:odorant receptor 131-2-like [Alosa alosa]